jgi:GT2 family glycosyltransferase
MGADNGMTMTINVIIATYNRAVLLEACLAQLGRQAFRPGDAVVVANNGSTDATERVAEEAAARWPGLVRVVNEPRPGKSIAVASALNGCGADVLAFTDDDVLVADDWIARIRQAMANTDVALVGGPVLPMYARRVPDWLDLHAETGFGRMAAPLALLHYGYAAGPLGPRVVLGANMAVRREAFLAVGGYPANLGKLRGTLLSGEDHELCERIQTAGYTAVYDPAVRVRHLVPADRLKIGYFLRWFFWSGMTHAAMERDRSAALAGRRVLGAPGYVIREIGSGTLQAAASALRASWTAAASQATRAAFGAGYVWGTWRLAAAARLPTGRHGVEAA